MKVHKTALIYGGIASSVMIISWFMMNGLFTSSDGSMDFTKGQFIGYAAMILGLTAIFIGVKRYRDNHLNGVISFKKAFLAGAYMVLIASVIYVIGWMIYYPNFIPDFTDKYAAYQIQQYADSGLTGAELAAKKEDIHATMETYKKPQVVIAYTFMEIFPVGLIVALISAFILKTPKHLRP